MVAGDYMIFTDLPEIRKLRPAQVVGMGAAGVKGTTRVGVERGKHPYK